ARPRRRRHRRRDRRRRRRDLPARVLAPDHAGREEHARGDLLADPVSRRALSPPPRGEGRSPSKAAQARARERNRLTTSNEERGSMAEPQRFIGERAARQLSNTTKTPPQWRGATPRWLVQLLPWAPVEAGVYRVNQALDDEFAVRCTPDP